MEVAGHIFTQNDHRLLGTKLVEQMANGWKRGFSGTSHADEKRKSL